MGKHTSLQANYGSIEDLKFEVVEYISRKGISKKDYKKLLDAREKFHYIEHSKSNIMLNKKRLG